jgi:tetratricopeptide (TPR) repeat protein
MQLSKPARKVISIEQEFNKLREKALQELRNNNLSEALASQALNNIEANFKKAKVSDQYSVMKLGIADSIRGAKVWMVIMNSMMAEVMALEERLSKRELYNDAWWQNKKSFLQEAFGDNPDAGKPLWLKSYGEALLAGEFDICGKLVQELSSFLPVNSLTFYQANAGTRALQEANYGDALEMLHHLISVTPEPETKALLEIFVGRIYQFLLNWRRHAHEHFEAARDLAPEAGPPYAALANSFLEDDSNLACDFAQRAVEQSPKLPDSYVALGRWAENQQYWDEAREHYNRAIDTVWDEKDPHAALTKLLAPFSGNLGLALAQRLYKGEEFDLALYTIDHALSLPIGGKESNPSAPAFELKSNILERLAKPADEVAEACYNAGWRYLYNNEIDKAKELLTKAKESYSSFKVNRDYFLTYCHLADAWRRSSFTVDGRPVRGHFEQSRTILDKGLRKGLKVGLPDAYDSWVYTLKALICAGLANFSESGPQALWWEAVTYLERAIFLKQDESYRWAYLGRFYRNLEVETNALQATEMALKYGPEELLPLEERIAISAEVGEFDPALELIDKTRSLASDLWPDAAKAFILLRKDQPRAGAEHYQEALDLLDKAAKNLPNEFWIRYSRALCYWLLHDLSSAVQDYQFIWDNYKTAPDYQKNLCLAALCLHKVEEYLEIHLGLVDDSFAFQANRVILFLARGNEEDLLAREEGFSKAVSQAHNPRLLSDLLNFDFLMLETYVDQKPHGPAVREILARLREKINDQLGELKKQPPSREKELQRIISQLKDNNETTGWPWIGVHASLGRLYVEQERWSEAAFTYRSLLEYKKEFPEAPPRLEEVIYKLFAEGDAFFQEGQVAKAADHLQRVLSPLLDPSNYLRQAGLENRLGYACYRSEDIDGARTHFVRAIKFYRDSGKKSPGQELGRTCASLLQNPRDYWRIDAEWQAHQQAPGTTEELSMDLQAARDTLANFLSDYYRLSSGVSDEMLPEFTPIVMELGEGLMAEGQEPLLQTYLPAMHNRIHEKMGVLIPEATVRINGTLDSNGYLLMLDELPLKVGKVEATDNPWIFLVDQLEALLLQNLEKYLGIEEVENLLSDWEKTEDGASLIRSALPDQLSRLRFAHLLRNLVAEKVPVTRWQVILETIKDTGLTDDNLDETVRTVRLQLKDQLPGNDKDTLPFALSEEIETKLRSGIQQQNNKRFLALPLGETKDLLAMIRELVEPEKKKSVLVTRDHGLRPFVRQLIRQEFPDLMVLAQEEIPTAQDLPEPALAAEPEPSQGDTLGAT